jgi:hypothetical protein
MARVDPSWCTEEDPAHSLPRHRQIACCSMNWPKSLQMSTGC